jgi:hypothetical protein
MHPLSLPLFFVFSAMLSFICLVPHQRSLCIIIIIYIIIIISLRIRRNEGISLIKCKERVTMSTNMEKAIFVTNSKEMSCVRCPRLTEISNNSKSMLLYIIPHYRVFTKNRTKNFAIQYLIKKAS